MQNAITRQLHRHGSCRRLVAFSNVFEIFATAGSQLVECRKPTRLPLRQRLGDLFIASVATFALLLVGDLAVAQSQSALPPAAAQAEQPLSTSDLNASDAKAVDGQAAVQSAQSLDELRFRFERTPWREVINWVAEASDLALQYEDLPTGSFSYSDPRSYTPEEALSRINLFLLPQGYSLVRSNQLLSVINQGDPRSVQQLDALAQLVAPEDLQTRPRHEVVKCMFALGELDPDAAVEELSVIKLMTRPLAFSRTRQLMITDTVEKLQQVKQILSSFQPSMLEEGMEMASFLLEHVAAEDVLLVARPHLGLATGEMIGIDVSISTDLQGEHIFVSGVEDKVKLIENIVKSLDRPAASLTINSGENELKSHLVTGGNLEMVYDVLKTLMAGRSLRLSADQATSSIVALATPDIQNEIAATVAQLQAAEADFEVIPLRSSDPYQIITLLEEMLDLPDEYADEEDIPPDTPKIDADPANRRLFVRAKPYQIEQIKKIVQGLDRADVSNQQELRVLPLQGKQAEAVLEAATRFWQGQTPVVVLPASSADAQPEVIEKVPNEEAPDEPVGDEVRIAARLRQVPVAGVLKLDDEKCSSSNCDEEAARDEESPVEADDFVEDVDTVNTEFVGFETGASRDADFSGIRCQLTPNGLVIESRDVEALDRFEDHLRAIAGPMRSSTAPPTVFYLQYTKPNDALRLLAELLDGGESAREASSGTLVRGYVSSPGSYLGSIVTSRDGTMTMMAGTITVVADTRLNRLIAQGTAADVDMIQGYLKIIDKDSSITEVRTEGMSQIIELQYTAASEVAEVIREAFASRMATGSGSARGGPSGQPGADGRGGRDWQRPEETDRDRDRDGGDENRGEGQMPGGGSTAAVDREPKMTVAVHEPSNSLIITAPEQLYVQVEQLVKLIDTRSEEVVEVLAPENAAYIQSVLQPGSSNARSNASSRDRSRGSSNNRNNSSNRSRSQDSRVMEMLRGRGR